jgi:hypothetical protein
VAEQQRQDAISQCEAGTFGDPRINWTPEFAASVDECGATLSCEDFMEDLDDLCYPRALASHAEGLLSQATTDACLLSDSTNDCDTELSLKRETGTSVVAACFRRWSECKSQRSDGDPFWTEDHCGSLIALRNASRSAADPCLSLPCSEVSACLVSAGAFGF